MSFFRLHVTSYDEDENDDEDDDDSNNKTIHTKLSENYCSEAFYGDFLLIWFLGICYNL